MQLSVFGINHVTAGIALRERFAIAPAQQQQALQSLLDRLAQAGFGNAEAIVLSTCNRTEIITNQIVLNDTVLHWLLEFCSVPSVETGETFQYEGKQAWLHLAKVASGLDSMVMGEPQIFGQLKAAQSLAERAGAVGSSLQPTMQRIFSAAKQVRHETAIGETPVSVAYAAVTLARRIFASLANTRVLLVGAGETITLVARHLQQAGVTQISVANRTLENARVLAEEVAGEAALLSDIPELLPKHDIVVSSTASTLPILGKGAVEAAVKRRKRRPILMLDLAVPRDIEPQVSSLQDIYLYTVDDLQSVVEQNRALRESERTKAEAIIESGFNHYVEWLNTRKASDLVTRYRGEVAATAERELAQARKQLSTGAEPEQLLEELARNLSRKIMHGPTIALRDAAARDDQAYLHVARSVLGISDEGMPDEGMSSEVNEANDASKSSEVSKGSTSE